MHHAADADDAAQTGLLKLFERASEFDPQRDALAWIVGIASYECLTLRRKTTRRRESGGEALAAIVDAGPTPEERVISASWSSWRSRCSGSCGPRIARPCASRCLERGERLAAPATFRKRVERALVRLRAAWRDHGIG